MHVLDDQINFLKHKTEWSGWRFTSVSPGSEHVLLGVLEEDCELGQLGA
jgi:hypothetical protein